MFNRKNKGWFALLIALFLMSTSVAFAEGDGENTEGKKLFKVKCATCHAPHRDMTGPALFQMREAWAEAGAGDVIYDWVHNWKKAAATNAYAKEVADWSPAAMQTFPDLTKEQIDAIFDYVDAVPKPGANNAAAGGATATPGAVVASKDDSLNPIWYILGAIFIVIIFSASAVKRQLQNLDGAVPEEKKIGSKKWLWKNKKWLAMGGFVITVGVITYILLLLYNVNVMTSYHPSQPITFRHDIHAGINGIDCKYCHNSVNKSKTAGIPTLNVCMNCHKLVRGSNEFQKNEIAKLYEAVGFSSEGGGQFKGEDQQEPIVWNKVHNLPDFVFFSHKQHVEVGGVDCKQCHGDMTKRHETAQVMPVEELNKIEGNINLGTHPTLTMGWCVECHAEKAISKGPLDSRGGYYDEIHERLLEYDKEDYAKFLEDGKVTVKELGGWECAKCHY